MATATKWKSEILCYRIFDFKIHKIANYDWWVLVLRDSQERLASLPIRIRFLDSYVARNEKKGVF